VFNDIFERNAIYQQAAIAGLQERLTDLYLQKKIETEREMREIDRRLEVKAQRLKDLKYLCWKAKHNMPISPQIERKACCSINNWYSSAKAGELI
jgi:hypothetical protein